MKYERQVAIFLFTEKETDFQRSRSGGWRCLHHILTPHSGIFSLLQILRVVACAWQVLRLGPAATHWWPGEHQLTEVYIPVGQQTRSPCCTVGSVAKVWSPEATEGTPGVVVHACEPMLGRRRWEMSRAHCAFSLVELVSSRTCLETWPQKMAPEEQL